MTRLYYFVNLNSEHFLVPTRHADYLRHIVHRQQLKLKEKKGNCRYREEALWFVVGQRLESISERLSN